MWHKIFVECAVFLTLCVAIVILSLTLRGTAGTPHESVLNSPGWKEKGPFELSKERGTYALTYSLIENKSYHFSPYLAQFVSPDLGGHNGIYVSLLPPGLSYLVMPGYILGKRVDMAQVGSFAIIAAMALINVLLLLRLSRHLGAHPAASLLAGIIFLFATPAFSYATTLYQHHVTSFLLLLSFNFLIPQVTVFSLSGIWIAMGIAITVDTPNALFFAPIACYALWKCFSITRSSDEVVIAPHWGRLILCVLILLPLAGLAYFNVQSYGSPWQLGGTVRRVTDISLEKDELTGDIRIAQAKLEDIQGNKSFIPFFKTREMLNGIYEHLAAPDRGVIFFTPVILLSLLGMLRLPSDSREESQLILTTAAVILLVYSLWGDPYGGWAFGSRYLIPVYALITPFLALALTRYVRDIWFNLLFLCTGFYSLGVNVLGALTSNANPPTNELTAMWKNYGYAPPVGYINNWDKLWQNQSSSYAYTTYFREVMSLPEYALLLAGALGTLVLLLMIWLFINRHHGETP